MAPHCLGDHARADLFAARSLSRLHRDVSLLARKERHRVMSRSAAYPLSPLVSRVTSTGEIREVRAVSTAAVGGPLAHASKGGPFRSSRAYSARSTVIGSTLVARHAGRQHAESATTRTTAAAPISVEPSAGTTP
jgi:hypothetical protein